MNKEYFKTIEIKTTMCKMKEFANWIDKQQKAFGIDDIDVYYIYLICNMNNDSHEDEFIINFKSKELYTLFALTFCYNDNELTQF